MHTVVETPAFITSAAKAGVSADEITAIVNTIAADPQAGDEMRGTGGCRKIRFARPGKVKSGGYRVVTFFSGVNVPVFLLAAFGKNQKANITRAEANALKALTKRIVDTYAK